MSIAQHVNHPPTPIRGVRLDDLLALRPAVRAEPTTKTLVRHLLTHRRLIEDGAPTGQTRLLHLLGGPDTVRAEIIRRELNGEGVRR